MKPRCIIAGVAAAVAASLLSVAAAAADPAPPVHLQSASTVKTDGGSELRLPPSYCLDEPAWDHLDLKVRGLQEEGTRLRAENASLKKDSGSSWFGWKSATAALALGIALGAWAYPD